MPSSELGKLSSHRMMRSLALVALQGYPGLGQERHRIRIGIVAGVDNPPQTGVDDHLGAGQAGLVGDVERAAVHADAVLRGLDDGVLLGVQRADAVAVDHQSARCRRSAAGPPASRCIR